MNSTKIIGHRGAAGLALENTIESIKVALQHKVDAIEIDVRRTQDGQLVLLHDAHTGHVSNKTLLVHRSTLAELHELTLHNGERIPTLDEALGVIGSKTRVLIDIKSSSVSDEMLRVLQNHPGANILFTGLHYQESRKLHAQRPDLHFLVQHHFDPIDIVQKASRLGAKGVSINLWIMNPVTYYLARRRDLEVFVYTLNRRWLLRFFKLLYPHAAIITNHPEKML